MAQQGAAGQIEGGLVEPGAQGHGGELATSGGPRLEPKLALGRDGRVERGEVGQCQRERAQLHVEATRQAGIVKAPWDDGSAVDLASAGVDPKRVESQLVIQGGAPGGDLEPERRVGRRSEGQADGVEHHGDPPPRHQIVAAEQEVPEARHRVGGELGREVGIVHGDALHRETANPTWRCHATRGAPWPGPSRRLRAGPPRGPRSR